MTARMNGKCSTPPLSGFRNENAVSEQASSGSGSLGRNIVRAVAVIVFFGLFLKLGGLLMNLLVVSYYGKGQVYDIFTAVYSNVVVLFFFSSLLKVLLPAFMPIFSELMHEEGERKAWQFVNTVLNLLLIAIAGAAILIFALAPEIISTILPKFTGEAQTRAAQLLRWMAPGLVILLLAVKAQAILNSYKVFSYPKAGEATQKLIWVAAIFVAGFGLGFSQKNVAAHVLGIGFLIGCLAQAGVLIAGLRKHAGLYRPAFPSTTVPRLLKEAGWLLAAVLLCGTCAAALSFFTRLPESHRKFIMLTSLMGVGCLYALWLRHRAAKSHGIMARFALLAAPLIVGVVFARYRDLATTFFQSYSAEGEYGIIELAKKVAQLPTEVVAYALGIAMFPFLCDLAAKKQTENLSKVVGRTVRLVALFFVPLTCVTIVMAGPVMRMLADRGDWSATDVRSAAIALGLLSTGMFFMSIENVLMQTFFSLQRVILPTVLGIVFSGLYSIGLYVTIDVLGYREPEQAFLIVCIAYPLPRILKNTALAFFLHRQVSLFTLRRGTVFVAQIATICAAVAASAWIVYRGVERLLPLPQVTERGIHVEFEFVKAVHLGAPSAVALVVFVAGCVLLRVEEFRIAVQWVRDKGWRKRPAQASNSTPESRED